MKRTINIIYVLSFILIANVPSSYAFEDYIFVSLHNNTAETKKCSAILSSSRNGGGTILSKPEKRHNKRTDDIYVRISSGDTVALRTIPGKNETYKYVITHCVNTETIVHEYVGRGPYSIAR